MIAYLVIGLLSGAAYALLAMGFVLVYKGTRIFNLAHGEIGAVGLYAAWALLGHVPAFVAALVGIAVAALVGLVMERTLVRRLVDRTPLAALAATLGAGLTLAYLEVRIFGINIKTFPSPVGSGAFHLGSVVVTAPRLAALVVAAITGIGLGLFLRRTRFGLAVWASTSDQALARLSGIAVDRTRGFVWALGGALSGASALLLAPIFTFHPLSNTLVLVRALAGALLGGLTSLQGAFVGGLVVGIVESLTLWRSNIAGAADGAIFGVLLISLLVRPRGLFGAQEA